MLEVILVDYYTFPDSRIKQVSKLIYFTGRYHLLKCILKYPEISKIHICITGGIIDEGICNQINDNRIQIHQCIDNTFQDFSGYLYGAQIIEKINFNRKIIFLNSSCPVSYIDRTIQYLLINQHDNGNHLIGPGFSSINRLRKFPFLDPHIQSYCFAISASRLQNLITFINSTGSELPNNPQKVDFILFFEIGLSDLFIKEYDGLIWITSTLIGTVINSKFSKFPLIIDSRYRY